MTYSAINVGSAANDGTGDPLRTAFTKGNSNFAELYAGLGGLLAKSGVAVPLTGSSAETVLATFTIPGGTLGANAMMEICALFSCTNNADSKTIRIRLGGLSGSIIYSGVISAGTPQMVTTRIFNRGATNSQIALSFGNRGTDLIDTVQQLDTASVDMTSNCALVITGQLATTTDTLQLEAYSMQYVK